MREGLLTGQGEELFFENVLCKYLLHDCLIRLNNPSPEQCLCLPGLKKPSKLNTKGILYEEKYGREKKR